MTLRINLWSSPRNLSTAMMYSWRQRSDTTVVDEPLYAHYLATTGREHPGSAEVLAAQHNDGANVVADVLLAPYDRPVVLFKQMAKHIVGLDRSFLGDFTNVFLTRDPVDMLRSLQVQLPDVSYADTGFAEMVTMLDSLLASGHEPIVVETSRLLADPEATLRAMCQRIGIRFDPEMLSWPEGPKPEDGVWAPHWYERVHTSSGWKKSKPRSAELGASATAALPQCEAAFERLVAYRL